MGVTRIIDATVITSAKLEVNKAKILGAVGNTSAESLGAFVPCGTTKPYACLPNAIEGRIAARLESIP